MPRVAGFAVHLWDNGTTPLYPGDGQSVCGDPVGCIPTGAPYPGGRAGIVHAAAAVVVDIGWLPPAGPDAIIPRGHYHNVQMAKDFRPFSDDEEARLLEQGKTLAAEWGPHFGPVEETA